MKIENRLKAKMRKAGKKKSKMNPRETNDIFERCGMIIPSQLHAINYFNRKPIAAFNPGASEIYDGNKIDIYPRIHFPGIYSQSPAVIGKFQLNVDDLIKNHMHHNNYSMEILLYPTNPWELIGCEDARIFGKKDDESVLYTGWGICDGEKKSVLGMMHGNEKNYFRIGESHSMKEYIPFSNKDAAILSISHYGKMRILTRLHFGDDHHFCWSGEAWNDTYEIIEETLEVQMIPNDEEDRIGWSTNAVKISSNEYLVGWHAILKQTWQYNNGLAIVDESGNLKAISDYLLVPQGIDEWVGNRYGVIFGCGLVKYKDQLIWVGGISDWAIGIFHTDFEKAMSQMRWIK